MAEKKSNTKEPTSEGSSVVPPKKILRSQDPDVIVAVGQGDNKIEFECYRVLLCYNCEYFDTMFSLPMKEKETSRIDLPDKDPKEWKIFYEFIDPATANLVQVTKENAMVLVPWFHEYQMNELLEKCDAILNCDNTLHVYNYNSVTVDNLETLLDTINTYERYCLKKSTEKKINELSDYLKRDIGLLKDNLEILKRVFDVYKGHKESMTGELCSHIEELFTEIEENESDGEDIWENMYFRCMIKTKVENVILNIESEKKMKEVTSLKNKLLEVSGELEEVKTFNRIFSMESEKKMKEVTSLKKKLLEVRGELEEVKKINLKMEKKLRKTTNS